MSSFSDPQDVVLQGTTPAGASRDIQVDEGGHLKVVLEEVVDLLKDIRREARKQTVYLRELS